MPSTQYHFPRQDHKVVTLIIFSKLYFTFNYDNTRAKIAESVVKRLSGNGGEGYSDGESGSARFKKPRGFAVDRKGNVFVADKSNNVIRKISASGFNPSLQSPSRF